MVDRARFVISGGVPTREALRVHALDFGLASVLQDARRLRSARVRTTWGWAQ